MIAVRKVTTIRDNADAQYCVPLRYISTGTPSKVILVKWLKIKKLYQDKDGDLDKFKLL